MVTIIGLVGRAGVGKSTAAAYLERALGAHRMAFADKVKRIASRVYNIPIEHFYDRAWKEAPRMGPPGSRETLPSPRECAVTIGEVMREEVAGDVWIRPIFADVEQLRRDAGKHLFVIEDVRHGNEARAIKGAWGMRDVAGFGKGILVKIERTDRDSKEGDRDRYVDEEIPPGLIDRVVRNDGTVAELEAALREALCTPKWDVGEVRS